MADAIAIAVVPPVAAPPHPTPQGGDGEVAKVSHAFQSKVGLSGQSRIDARAGRRLYGKLDEGEFRKVV